MAACNFYSGCGSYLLRGDFPPPYRLPHSRAESLQWDEGHRQMTAGESDALAERLAGVKFNIRASGSTTLYMEHITVFFDDRKAQTILYCMEDGTLWLTEGKHRYAGPGCRAV